MCFTNHDDSETIERDNVSYLVYAVFKEFIEKNCIKHIHTSPYHSSINDLENTVVLVSEKTIKVFSKDNIDARLVRFLLAYRKIPQMSTGY